ncbi:hypothetical protein KEM48_007822, partial [Puccinia striiformis f. sp. tritici PST-130]
MSLTDPPVRRRLTTKSIESSTNQKSISEKKRTIVQELGQGEVVIGVGEFCKTFLAVLM